MLLVILHGESSGHFLVEFATRLTHISPNTTHKCTSCRANHALDLLIMCDIIVIFDSEI